MKNSNSRPVLTVIEGNRASIEWQMVEEFAKPGYTTANKRRIEQLHNRLAPRGRLVSTSGNGYRQR